MSFRFVDRALNKNKKPSKKTIRASNDILGELRLPMSFLPSAQAFTTAYTIPRVNARIPAHHAAFLLFLAEHSFKQCIPC